MTFNSDAKFQNKSDLYYNLVCIADETDLVVDANPLLLKQFKLLSSA